MEAEFERPLQTLESMIVWGQPKKGDVTVLPTCELRLTKTIKIDLMKSAVNDIVIRHPNLRAVILDKEQTPPQEREQLRNSGQEGSIPKEKCFSLCILESSFALEKFDFFEHIRLEENEKWDFSIAETQMRRSPGVGPDNQQFRVVLVTSSSVAQNDQFMEKITPLMNPSTAHLMLFYNHAICDGMSGYILMNDILARYTQLSTSNNEYQKPSTNKKYEIVPTIWQLNNNSKICQSGDVDKVELPEGNNVNGLIAELNRQNETYTKCIPTKTCISGVVKDGCVCLKGTADGMAKLKARCKEANTTVGMAVLAAVYWTLAQFIDEVPIMNIDVDLRRRFQCSKEDKKELPPQVALLIGMTSVHRVAKIDKKEEDCQSYALRLQNELKRSLEDGEHFDFHHAIEQRWLDDLPDYKDMNFSNMGLYPFPTKFDASGLEIMGYWTLGDGWCPVMFGTMVFLINTIPGVGQFYTMVFEDFKDNRQLAKVMLEEIRDLCEQ